MRSKRFLIGFAMDHSHGYESMMAVAERFLRTKERRKAPKDLRTIYADLFGNEEFWEHYECVTGQVVDPEQRGTFEPSVPE